LLKTDGLTTALSGKQPTIEDGDLTIAKTSGLATALDAKQATIDEDTDLTCNSLNTNQLIVNEDLYFDTIVIRRPTGFSGGGTTSSEYVIILSEIQLWVNASNRLTDANTTSYFADWAVDKDVDIGHFSSYLATNIYNNIIESGYGVVSPFDRDENVALIISGFPKTDINKIQSIVVYNRQDGNVAIDRTLGLALELYNRENDANLETPLASSNEISVERDVYRFDFPAIDTYPTGDFSNTESISKIASETLALKEVVSDIAYSATNIITELGTKQATIDEETDLSCNSLTTTTLNVNGGVDIDTGEYFDTLVLRFPDLETTNNIQINELQVWVNGSNLLVENSATLTSYFAEWEVDKDADLNELSGYPTPNVYNNVIESVAGAVSDFGAVANALIIKDIPSTLINNIQAIVHYNRSQHSYTQDKAIGLIYELYNETNDPTFTRPLATTDEISVSAPVYRFDFPSITTYSDFATGESLTNIIREEDATTETANYERTTFEVKGNVDITGDLVVGTTNIITELGTKQDEITTSTDLTNNSITTTENATIGGTLNVSGSLSNPNQPAFKVIRTNTSTSCASGENLKFNEAVIDTRNAYNSTNF